MCNNQRLALKKSWYRNNLLLKNFKTIYLDLNFPEEFKLNENVNKTGRIIIKAIIYEEYYSVRKDGKKKKQSFQN